MNFKMIKLLSFLFLSMSLFLVSCGDTDSDLTEETVQNYVDEAVFSVQDECNAGRHGCFELIFPIEVEMSDGTIIEAEDYADLKEQVRAWKELNPDATGRPQLVFPVELITEGGIIITVSSKQHLRTVRKICRRIYFANHDWDGHSDRPLFCFRLQFPLTLTFPNADNLEVENKRQLKLAIRAWKALFPDIDENPGFLYPIMIKMEDGTVVEVNSSDELRAIKDDCAD